MPFKVIKLGKLVGIAQASSNPSLEQCQAAFFDPLHASHAGLRGHKLLFPLSIMLSVHRRVEGGEGSATWAESTLVFAHWGQCGLSFARRRAMNRNVGQKIGDHHHVSLDRKHRKTHGLVNVDDRHRWEVLLVPLGNGGERWKDGEATWLRNLRWVTVLGLGRNGFPRRGRTVADVGERPSWACKTVSAKIHLSGRQPLRPTWPQPTGSLWTSAVGVTSWALTVMVAGRSSIFASGETVFQG